MISPATNSPSSPSYTTRNNHVVQLRSNYELAFAHHLDLAEANWEYETRVFDYEDRDGKKRKYHPDFYLPDCDVVIEVSSRWTNRNEKDRKILALRTMNQRVLEVTQAYLQKLPMFGSRRWRVSFSECPEGKLNHKQKLRELLAQILY